MLFKVVLWHSLTYQYFTFGNVDMARAAKDGLDGADIYSGCCTLKIEYAKVILENYTTIHLVWNNLRKLAYVQAKFQN